MAKEYKDLVVGLDIGTAKVMAVVAEVLPDGELHLAGLGIAFHAKPVVRQNARQSLSTTGLDGILYLIGIRDRETS